MFPALLLGALIGLQGRALAGSQPRGDAPVRAADPIELRVVVAAPVYQPNGAVSVEAATLPGAAPSLVYVYSRRSICDTAAAGSREPADAGFGWRLATNTVSRSTSETIVSVDWRRMWDRGQKVTNGPAGTVQLTLHAGDRIPLDHIPNMLATDACRAVGMGLEIRLARVAAAAPAVSSAVVLPLGAVDGGAAVLDADLWLMHTLPSGAEQPQHQTVRLPVDGGTFNFAPVRFDTARGEIGVDLAASFRRYRAPAGGELLLVSMTRIITGGTAPPQGLGGTTPGTLIPLPGPAEVLSFEMPGAGGAAQRGGEIIARGGRGGAGGGAVARSGGGGRGLAGGVVQAGSISPRSAMAEAIGMLDGHAFSIRVRLTPVTEK